LQHMHSGQPIEEQGFRGYVRALDLRATPCRPETVKKILRVARYLVYKKMMTLLKAAKKVCVCCICVCMYYCYLFCMLRQLACEYSFDFVLAQATYGEPYIGLQSDFWSTRNCGSSYASTSGTIIFPNGEQVLTRRRLCLGFSHFKKRRHTHKKVAAHLKNKMDVWRIFRKHVSVYSIDGEAAGKVAYFFLFRYLYILRK
jgi:hypothetical protein